MIRKTFESDIRQVKDEVLALGSMVEHATIASVEALKKRDIKAAERLILDDKEINKKRFAIENQLMILIATQQPMAHDLRLLASTMEIISELERPIPYEGNTCRVSGSIGAVLVTSGTSGNPEELHAAADEATYAAKRAGRGRCIVADGR